MSIREGFSEVTGVLMSIWEGFSEVTGVLMSIREGFSEVTGVLMSIWEGFSKNVPRSTLTKVKVFGEAAHRLTEVKS